MIVLSQALIVGHSPLLPHLPRPSKPAKNPFLELYHHAFAWLCESAERVEIHFLGQLSFSSNTEVLLPVEFTTQNLAMPATEPNNIAAWRGQQEAEAAA